MKIYYTAKIKSLYRSKKEVEYYILDVDHATRDGETRLVRRELCSETLQPGDPVVVSCTYLDYRDRAGVSHLYVIPDGVARK